MSESGRCVIRLTERVELVALVPWDGALVVGLWVDGELLWIWEEAEGEG